MRPSYLCHRVARRDQHGFTLVELMVTVILISILALAAIPAMQKASADRQAFSFATTTAAIVRDARTRALAHGTPVIVMLCSGANCAPTSIPNDNGSIAVFDPGFQTAATAQCPPTIVQARCDQKWIMQTAAGAPDEIPISLPVDSLSLNGPGLVGTADGLKTTLSDETLAVRNVAYICFSPGGLAYLAADTMPNTKPNFANVLPMTGDITFSIVRNSGGLTRTVVIPGNGAARVVTQ
jgi:prepilin-type N-terminal cleavage/methylation domain-containing protein